MSTVGVIGLGSMGAALARRLPPSDLVVFDVRPEAAEPFAQAGARVAASCAELASMCDVISVVVLDDAQVRDVAAQVATSARTGTVLAVHSTIAAATAVDLAGSLAPRGIEVVDAPVSGGAVGAHRGELAVLIGGSAEAVARCRTAFAPFASLIVHAGSVGAGTRMKLARNLIHFASFAAVGEASRLAEAAGLDLVELGKVVRHTDAITGGPGAIAHRTSAADVDATDPWFAILEHVRTLGEKDLDLALDLGRELDVDVPMTGAARAHLASALGVPHHEEVQ